MKLLAALACGLLVSWGLWWLSRCRHHDVILRQKRDPAGTVLKPHTLQWECATCFQIVGETEVRPKPRLLSFLYRQRINQAQRVRKQA